jgi:hypothetical protein
MMEQQTAQLAQNLMSLLERPDVAEAITVEGTQMVTDYLSDPQVRAYVQGLDVSSKVRLWGTPKQGMQILLHGADRPKKGAPHDHGESWALYYQVEGFTEMTSYHRLTGEQGQPGPAALEVFDVQKVQPGYAMFFGPHMIHSTRHPESPARWIRVTGDDLDYATRLRFSIERQEADLDTGK